MQRMTVKIRPRGGNPEQVVGFERRRNLPLVAANQLRALRVSQSATAVKLAGADSHPVIQWFREQSIGEPHCIRRQISAHQPIAVGDTVRVRSGHRIQHQSGVLDDGAGQHHHARPLHVFLPVGGSIGHAFRAPFCIAENTCNDRPVA